MKRRTLFSVIAAAVGSLLVPSSAVAAIASTAIIPDKKIVFGNTRCKVDRRLICLEIKKCYTFSTKRLVFEQLDRFTATKLNTMMQIYLEDLKSQRLILDYSVESLAFPSDKLINTDIFVKFERSVELTHLNFKWFAP